MESQTNRPNARDKTGRRGPAVVFGATWCVIAYACLRISIGESKWHRYAAVVFSMATNSNVQLVIPAFTIRFSNIPKNN